MGATSWDEPSSSTGVTRQFNAWKAYALGALGLGLAVAALWMPIPQPLVDRLIPENGEPCDSPRASNSEPVCSMFEAWDLDKRGRARDPYRTHLMLVEEGKPEKPLQKDVLTLVLQGQRFHVLPEWFAGLGYEVVHDRTNRIVLVRHPDEAACMAFSANSEYVAALWHSDPWVFDAWWENRLPVFHRWFGKPFSYFSHPDCYPIAVEMGSQYIPQAPARVFIAAMGVNPHDYPRGGVQFVDGPDAPRASDSKILVHVPPGNDRARLAKGRIRYSTAPLLVRDLLGRKGTRLPKPNGWFTKK